MRAAVVDDRVEICGLRQRTGDRPRAGPSPLRSLLEGPRPRPAARRRPRAAHRQGHRRGARRAHEGRQPARPKERLLLRPPGACTGRLIRAPRRARPPVSAQRAVLADQGEEIAHPEGLLDDARARRGRRAGPPEKITSGSLDSSGSCWIAASVSAPFITGIIQSSRMSPGRRPSLSSSRASTPLVAMKTWKPLSSSTLTAASRTMASSSTRRTALRGAGAVVHRGATGSVAPARGGRGWPSDSRQDGARHVFDRHDGRGQAGLDDAPRHTVYDAAALGLGQHDAARLAHGAGPDQAVGSHAGEHHPEHVRAERARRALEEDVDGGGVRRVVTGRTPRPAEHTEPRAVEA